MATKRGHPGRGGKGSCGGTRRRDGLNYVHMLGSCVLTIALSHFIHILSAGFIAFTLGFLWELLDEANKRFGWEIWFFDPAGFDWRDWLIMDLIGIILGLILC